MKKRLNIGLAIHHLENDYSRQVIRGAVTAAKELDVNLVVFAGRSINFDPHDKENSRYEYQYNVLYNFITPRALDGLIVSAATVGQFITREELKSFIDKYEGMPVLALENEVRGYPCLRFGSGGIKQAVEHLIKEHGCQRIAFVSGPKNNSDAAARLDAYRQALEENGLSCDESMIAYGNFSEYSENVVSVLLDSCGAIPDAICFANDNMCVGAYKEIRRRGLIPGKDILITGYDDSEIAMELDPPLTTVRAEADILGYKAVEKILGSITSGTPAESEELSASLVVRDSCSCETMIGSDGGRIVEALKGMGIKEKAAVIVNMVAGRGCGFEDRNIRSEIERSVAEIFYAVSTKENYSETGIIRRFDKMLDDGLIEKVSYETVSELIDTIRTVILSEYSKSCESKIRSARLFENMRCKMADHVIGMYYRQMTETSQAQFLISNITKDMMNYSGNEEKCYGAILSNLSRTSLKSTYIYLYETPIINHKDSEWKMPETLLLKGFHNGEDIVALEKGRQEIPWMSYLDNEFIRKDTQKTLVMAPLFLNDEQYGVIICDLEQKFFHRVYSVTPQICTAIKLYNLVNHLEGSLELVKNTNTILKQMSMSDELTGVYNRRGFYKYANMSIQNPWNKGRMGVLIFADLDNLKKINDTFGHDDGDYAIIAASRIIVNGLRNSDIVARIGGDEFAALAVVNDESVIAGISERIKAIAAEHNKNSDKPYNVTVSIGLCAFECNENIKVQSLMDKADAELYADKKNKNPDVMKH